MWHLLVKGTILGLSVSAPVGPIGILCINRALNKGFRSGLASGMGAATADLLYGTVAALGITLISDFLIDNKAFFQIIGMIFLFYIGISTILKKRRISIENRLNRNYLLDYTSTFLLTISNPLTILFFLSIFASMGMAKTDGTFNNTFPLLFGVFFGSATWWLILSGTTFLLKSKIKDHTLKLIDYISGSVILLFAVYILFTVIINI
jgi:threonine/homoserine/homoserine lactone efflux protein